MKNKIILTDVDGVLFDWHTAFDAYMQEHGYNIVSDIKTYSLTTAYGIEHDEKMHMVRQFNNSAAIGWLEPHYDAVEIVRDIHDNHGYKFEVISSMSDNLAARNRRINNLNNVFGDVFSNYIFLDTGADKGAALLPYKDSGCFWIEDKVENAQAGLDVGLRSIIMEHEFNADSTVAPIVKNWKHFYDEYIIRSKLWHNENTSFH